MKDVINQAISWINENYPPPDYDTAEYSKLIKIKADQIFDQLVDISAFIQALYKCFRIESKDRPDIFQTHQEFFEAQATILQTKADTPPADFLARIKRLYVDEHADNPPAAGMNIEFEKLLTLHVLFRHVLPKIKPISILFLLKISIIEANLSRQIERYRSTLYQQEQPKTGRSLMHPKRISESRKKGSDRRKDKTIEAFKALGPRTRERFKEHPFSKSVFDEFKKKWYSIGNALGEEDKPPGKDKFVEWIKAALGKGANGRPAD